MHIQLKYILLTTCLLIASGLHSVAQEMRLLGLVNEYLFEVNPNTAEIELRFMVDVPAGLTLANMVFSTSDCIFYATTWGEYPQLLSFDWEGNSNVIGPITFNGTPVFRVEGYAYNKTSNKLIGAMNQDSSASSPILVEIDPIDATSILLSEFDITADPDDIDNMDFIGNVLYFNDGNPIMNSSSFYEADMSGVGSTFTAAPYFGDIYYPVLDFAIAGPYIYFPSAYNSNGSPRELYRFHIANQNLEFIGETYDYSEFDNNRMLGLEYIEGYGKYIFELDTVLCENAELTLEVDIEDAVVTWNTGAVGNELVVSEVGAYWAEIVVDECLMINTDTVHVNLDLDCVDCAGVLNGSSIVDDCGECLEPTDPLFNQSCLDCMGVINGSAVIDDCGECLEPSDPTFGQSCFDCLDVLNGTAILDECGECLLPDDPAFNQSCLDCAGVVNGTAVIDDCGECVTTTDPSLNDCLKITFPNAFSPNGDGVNDTFGPIGDLAFLLEFELNVYNRWGERVFHSSDAQSSWSGVYKGEVQDLGVYVYEGFYAFGVERQLFKNNVTLVR